MSDIFGLSPKLDSQRESASGANVSPWKLIRVFLVAAFLLYLAMFILPLILCLDIILDEGNDSVISRSSKALALLWVITFFSLTLATTLLLIWRRNEHPLKARTPVLLCITVIGAVGMALWTALALIGFEPSCNGAHWVQNIFYPMFILPYFFRAQRVIAIFAQARRSHNQALAYAERKNRAGFGTFVSEGEPGPRETRLSLCSNQSVRSRSNSLLVASEEFGATGIEDVVVKKMTGAIEEYANQAKLLRWFGLWMIPFIFISVIDTLCHGNSHLLPSISAGKGSLASEKCDLKTPEMKVASIIVWILIHTLEASVFTYYYRKLRTVLKEFHTQQEFALIFVAEVIYTLIFISLLIPIANLNLDDIDHSVEYVVMSRSAYFMCVTILWPTYSTFFGTEAPMFPNRGVLSSLHNVLQDELAFKYFYAYLKNDETSSIYLQFWMAVDLFQENIDNHEMTGDALTYTSAGQVQTSCEARKLFQTYFTASGRDIETYFLNPDSKRQREVMMGIIPHNTVDDILAEIERCENGNLLCGRDVFEDAQNIAFQHLNDVYLLFLRSKECKELLHHVNGEEILFKALIEYKVI